MSWSHQEGNVKLFIALLSLMSVGADDHVIENLVAGCPFD